MTILLYKIEAMKKFNKKNWILIFYLFCSGKKFFTNTGALPEQLVGGDEME